MLLRLWVFVLLTPCYGWRPLNISNSSHCRNGNFENPIVRPGFITFNFYTKNDTRIYQVPKCLLGSDITYHLFDAINTTESLTNYEKRVTRFYEPPMNDILRLSPVPSVKQFNLDRSIQPQVVYSLNMYPSQGIYYVRVVEVRQMQYDNVSCKLPNSLKELIFPVQVRCAKITRYVGEDIYTHFFTPDFMILYIQNPAGDLTMMYGNTTSINFKAPYRKSSFIFKQTLTDDLLLIVEKDVIDVQYRFISDATFVDETLNDVDEVEALLLKFNNLGIQTLLRGDCKKPNYAGIPQMMFLYGIVHFSYSTKNTGPMPVLRVLKTHENLLSIDSFVNRCVNVSEGTLQYPKMKEFLKYEPSDYSYITKNKSISVSTLLTYLATAYESNVTISKYKWTDIANTLQNIYEKHMFFTNLTFSDRETLFMLAEIANFIPTDERMQRHMQLLIGNLCNPVEIVSWARMLTADKAPNLENIYSPCASPVRRDVTNSFLKTVLTYASLDRYRSDMMEMLSVYRPPNMERIAAIQCLSPSEPAASLTLPNVTFVISPSYVIKGVSLTITTTIVATSIIITAIPLNSTCVSTNYKYAGQDLLVLRNISSQTCEFCQSVVMEYDDIDGPLQYIYIKNIDELKTLTDPNNNLLVPNTRTHYLLLAKNGSVFEMSEVGIDIDQVSIILVIIYILIAIIALFGLYRLIRLC
uniref:Envelope glycoprotein H n=1 Tax=Human betaherpesvirus 6A TaxID=32603 RepID=A0A219XZN1_9BETA|nr:envelope glycoprotein H [Human betaherpesvirus 6A]APO38604.1 envelope glycoprotein H [Human betaherpesvirus 6A]AVK93670.1 U48 [Human betaherpesvirus 6A]